jgi:hypothetical protein
MSLQEPWVFCNLLLIYLLTGRPISTLHPTQKPGKSSAVHGAATPQLCCTSTSKKPLTGNARFQTGLIVADRFDAEAVREAPWRPLNPARRKAITLALARRAAHRWLGLVDPESALLGYD